MPAGPCDDQHSSETPPGCTNDSLTLKCVKLNDLLKKLTDKYQCDVQIVEQQSKETDLLIAVAQFILTKDDKRDFLSNVVTIGQNLLTDEYQTNNIEEISVTIDSSKCFSN